MNLLKRIPDRPLANWLMMLVMAAAIMLLLSRDSYLYLLGPRCDSAWFFMCGKAWMNGMVPYVDFADSKGPLLWLIYGVGYLLSHYDYHGVFWVSVVVYSGTFYFLFKTARIFVEHRSQAILAVLMTSVVIFNPITHDETRAEDFGMFFAALSLWQLCRLLYAEHTERDERIAFFAFGISLAGTLLIKYNITAMCCIFPAIGLYHLLRERGNVWRPLLACAAGFAVLALPFLICFLIQGNFSAFIQEYFINTLQTIKVRDGRSSLLSFSYGNFRGFFAHRALAIVLFCFGLFSLGISKCIKRAYCYVPALLIALSFVIINYSSNWVYYYKVLMMYGIWPALFLLIRFAGFARLYWVVGILGIVALFWNSLYMPCSINDSIMSKEYDAMERCFAGKKDIKVLYFGMENGFGITANSLPACKYWSRQNRATDEMIRNNEGCAINRCCDYVFVDLNREYAQQCIDLLVEHKYKKIHTMYYYNDKYMEVYASAQQ